MKRTLSRRITTILLCVTLLLIPKPARADDKIVSNGEIAGVIVAIVAVGVAVGIGVYFLVRKPPSITGCAASGSEGLTLLNESDAQTFTLIGDTAAIKPGDRIHVSGKKKKAEPSGKREFVVTKVTKNYGPCKISPAAP
jgi:hypothetical protein